MKKTSVIGGISTAALATMLTAVGTTAADAADCMPSSGASARPSAWAWTEFTSWQSSTESPADPDGEAGELNPANLTQIGEGYADTQDPAYRQKVSDGWQRFTGWQESTVPPVVGAHDEVGHRYVRTVGNNDGTPASAGRWWNWSPNKTNGPQDYEPAFPSDPRGTWQGPHAEGGPDGEGTFNASHGNSGNSSWFHREPATEGKPETTHTEYRWDVYAYHFEYRWSSYTRTIIAGSDPVTCPVPGDGDGDGGGGDDKGEGSDGQPPVDRVDDGGGQPGGGAEAPPSGETPGTASTDPVVVPAASSPTVSATYVSTAKPTAPQANRTKHRPAGVVPTAIDAGL